MESKRRKYNTLIFLSKYNPPPNLALLPDIMLFFKVPSRANIPPPILVAVLAVILQLLITEFESFP